MCPLLGPVFKGFFLFLFFAAAINSTNEANKAESTCCLAVYITYMSMAFVQQIEIETKK
jgi:hypothetical protein